MLEAKMSFNIRPPEGVLDGNTMKTYKRSRELVIEPSEGFMILRAVVNAINHYQTLRKTNPTTLVIGYEQYKALVAECRVYFKEENEIEAIDEVVLLGVKLRIVLLPSNVGMHIAGDVEDVFEFCAQKELYP